MMFKNMANISLLMKVLNLLNSQREADIHLSAAGQFQRVCCVARKAPIRQGYATLIQSVARGYIARKRALVFTSAALTIQFRIRQFLSRLVTITKASLMTQLFTATCAMKAAHKRENALKNELKVSKLEHQQYVCLHAHTVWMNRRRGYKVRGTGVIRSSANVGDRVTWNPASVRDHGEEGTIIDRDEDHYSEIAVLWDGGSESHNLHCGKKNHHHLLYA